MKIYVLYGQHGDKFKFWSVNTRRIGCLHCTFFQITIQGYFVLSEDIFVTMVFTIHSVEKVNLT